MQIAIEHRGTTIVVSGIVVSWYLPTSELDVPDTHYNTLLLKYLYLVAT